MTSADFPWEPPLAGTEPEHLFGALDRLRTTFRWKADGLDAAGLQARVASSTMTLGSLLKHLAFVESYYARYKLAGESPGAPWEAVDWEGTPNWDFESASEDSPETLYALYDEATDSARQIYAKAVGDGGLDQEVALGDDQRGKASLRRLVFDLVEEYGRHTGHADLLREAVDGRVGEDPPAGWRPESGTFVVPGT
jgi:hypothetical protein